MASTSPSEQTLSRVPESTIERAVDALLKWIKSKAKNQKAQLLDHDEFLYLILTLKKIPQKGRVNPHKIPLPHPLHEPHTHHQLCLIIDDRSKSALTSDAAKKKIDADNIPVSKVLKLSKLKSDYKPFEAKRQLCGSYDLFLADKRVIPTLPKLLGKEFFKKKKIPVPVDLGRGNWREQVEGVCGSALVYLRTGSCSVVKVARVSSGREAIVENVVAAIEGAVDGGVVPRKWANVRAIHLKAAESVALPIYQAMPTMGLKIAGVRKEEENVDNVEEEEKREEVKKIKKKRVGRIHEVNLDEMLSVGNSEGSESDEDEGREDAELANKKRKKKDEGSDGEKKKKEIVKGIVEKPKKNSLLSEELGGRGVEEEEEDSDGLELKKKSKVGKIANGELKMKSKKSKRV
ncbi:hypothetical protein Scep_026023 [Stephania cephalantha]|uniref:Ribosomal protein L1 n=1 Tax=Stephania cephalantha TaxID=152367 RepID=A0AAP0ET85_9MAGN